MEDFARFFVNDLDCGLGSNGFSTVIHSMSQQPEGSVIVIFSQFVAEPPVADHPLVEEWARQLKRFRRLQFESDDVTFRRDEIGILSWLTPYDDPLDSSGAQYFLAGKPCGKGDIGFSTVLTRLETNTCIKAIVLLGAPYSIRRSWPPDPKPFREREGDLQRVLQTRNIKLLGMIDQWTRRDTKVETHVQP